MKPILFNSQMVRAILDGRKAQTRRISKNKISSGMSLKRENNRIYWSFWEHEDWRVLKTKYNVGDVLYVRETWKVIGTDGTNEVYGYKVDGQHGGPWKPSIHMPKEAARLFLRVTNVRVERLQEITEEQSEKEGCSKWGQYTDMEVSARSDFCNLWDSTIKPADREKYRWDANPWVEVYEFEVITKEEAYNETD